MARASTRSRSRSQAGRVAGLAVAAVIVGFVVWQRGGSSSPDASRAGPVASTDVEATHPAEPISTSARADALVEFYGETMATTYTVKASGPELSSRRDVVQAEIDTAMRAVDERMSNYRADSELSQFNLAPAGQPITLSPELYFVFELSRRVTEESGGAFDITVAPVVDAYGFGPGEATDDPAELARRRQLVGPAQLEWPGPNQVSKRHADVACTLSAIAKGYAVDKVAQTLERLGVADYMVEIGGEVRVGGQRPDGAAWRVGIERPAEDAMAGPQVQRALELRQAALATSGDYRNYREVDGRRISHTLDPRTGRPIEHTLASVSVIAKTAAEADAYATALDVLGPVDGLALAETLGLAALFLVRDGDQFVEQSTTAFTPYLERP